MILDTLAASTRRRVEAAKEKIPLSTMMDLASQASESEREVPLTCVQRNVSKESVFSFEKALKAPGMSFICEVKKASPSKGLIASDFPYVDIAKDYEAAGASAISVLTEPEYFLGSNEYLKEIRRHVSVPLLRKDFTVDPYMVYEARCLGADAVLLIAALLSDRELSEYRQMAESLGMDALVEAHDEREVTRALKSGAKILGVNNRNLKDFTVDVGNSLRLRPLVPPEIPFIAESGIHDGAAVKLLAEHGVSGVLIGELLMRSPSIEAKMKELLEAAS